MLLKNLGQAHKRQNAAGSEGGEGGSGSGVDPLKDPAIQKLLQEKVEQEVAGLKKKNSDLIGVEKKLKEQMAQFEGLDVERLKNLQKQMDQNEELRLLSEGKTEEVFTRRVELLKKDYDAQIAARDGKLQEVTNVLKQKEENLRKLVVDGTVRESYITLDFEPTALEDVIRSAREVFIMDDEGKVVPRDTTGNIIFSKDGTTPIDAKGWLELQAERKPYLRRASKGAGAGGNRSYGGNLDKLSSTSKIAEGLKGLGFK